MSGRKKKISFSSPSAVNALERALMSQQEPISEPPRRSIYDGDAPSNEVSEEIPPESEEPPEEQSRIDEELRAQIQERQNKRRAETVSRFQKLDTKVQIGDIGRNFDRTRSPRVQVVSNAKEGTREAKIKERTETWKNWVIQDANPLLLKATQTWCAIPDHWLDGVVLSGIDPNTNKALTFWDPPLRSRLELSEKKAKTLARAAAEFSVSPMGVAVVTWVESHQFMIAMGAAMWVAAQYGWVLMQTKAEVAQVLKIVEQQTLAQMQNQAAMAEHGPATNGAARYPNFGETTANYDAEQNT